MRTWSVIGTGVAATAVAALLARKGDRVASLWSRNPKRARAVRRLIGQGRVCRTLEEAARAGGWILLGVPDDAIRPMAIRLKPALRPGQRLVHLSGAVSLPGAGCIHPLQTIPTPEEGIRRLPGSFFGVEGPRELDRIVRKIGGIPFRIPRGQKPLHHAAAVMASNHVVALAAAAVEMGLSLPALLPLMQGTVDALRKDGLPGALTGPVARGDAKTVRAHLKAIPADLRPLYLVCARQALRVAVAKGLAPSAARVLRRTLR